MLGIFFSLLDYVPLLLVYLLFYYIYLGKLGSTCELTRDEQGVVKPEVTVVVIRCKFSTTRPKHTIFKWNYRLLPILISFCQ